MNNTRLSSIAVSLAVSTLACGGGDRGENDTGISTGGPSGGPGSDSGPSDGSGTTGSSTGDPDSGTLDGSTSGGPTCETVQCGATCCGGDEECVLGECRDTCESGVRCGDDLSICCGSGDVCLQPECVTPGADCIDSFDCTEGEFCEPTLQKCLPQQEPVVCEIVPVFEDIQVTLEWSFTQQQIISMPLVGDIDGDGDPEVVVATTHHDDNGNGSETDPGEGILAGIIIVFDGRTGTEQFRILDDPPNSFGSYPRSSIGLSDVDGNGLPDIVYVGRPQASPLNQSTIHAVNGQGQHLWSSHVPGGDPYALFVRNGGPTFANFDDDAASEIIFGAAILDNDGTVVWDEPHPAGGVATGYGAWFGSDPSFEGGISAAADLTGDGYPEIISGRHAWAVDWQPGTFFPEVTLTNYWDAGGDDGYPAIGDLDQDGDPEVVLVANGQLRILDGATGALWCGIDASGAACVDNDAARAQPLAIPGGGLGGPPTIADFDGDGRPEVAGTGAQAYTVYDFNRTGEAIVQPVGDPPPGPGQAFVRWTTPTNDASVAAGGTGSSVFDFQGDGVAEVLYGDQCYVRVYDGPTGDVILQIENSNRTVHEYPIVVDVDADGNSEILVVANDSVANQNDHCGTIPNYTARRGLFVYGDVNDQWQRTRRVWNQHAYHVTNSDAMGATPAVESNNWENPELNNYRQNVQGEPVFNAPDLSVDLSVGFGSCLDQEFEIIATVRNEGSLGVPAGVQATLYEGSDASGDQISSQSTVAPLLPGAFVNLSWFIPAPGGQPKNFYVSVDGADEATGLIGECNEDNNTAATQTVACPIPG